MRSISRTPAGPATVTTRGRPAVRRSGGGRSVRRPQPAGRYRLKRRVGLGLLAVFILIWTLLPLYNMLMLAVSPQGEVFQAHFWPAHATISNFANVVEQQGTYVANFWQQFGNSALVAVVTTVLVLIIGTMASYGVERLRPRWGAWVSNAALATYVIPLSFVAIPLYKVMAVYNLLNTEWSLTLAMTAFASPYAIWVFSQYARSSISFGLDESARVDGANAWQIYLRIYLPLMKPVLVAIGVYALLLAWNEYLLAFLLLGSGPQSTLPVALADFLNTDTPPWNMLMATSLFYALPPVVIYYLFRNYLVGGLTAGSVKG